MCGFAGVIAWQDRFGVSADTLEQMRAAVAHRGPDGQGTYFNHQELANLDRPLCAMAFCRLAVIDPDPRAMQPFHLHQSPGKPRLSLVFNGEIYNFRELKAELSSLRPDYTWRTTSDTEVILLAYDSWREHCVDKFDGMFALAIWDERERSLFLARDRMGQKPLYLAMAEGGPGSAVAFASELAALTPVPWVDQSINFSALSDYLSWGYIGGEQTIYTGAAKLPASSWRQISSLKSRSQKYFDPNEYCGVDAGVIRDDGGHDAASNLINSTRSMLTDAVRRQLVSDVPVGCFLSGGIDSSIIASAMKRVSTEPVHTFSIGFGEAQYDESSYAAEVAAHVGTIHHAFRVCPDAAADLPRLARVFGEPFADSSALPTHYLSQQAREFVKVVISGDGGDELFGGYNRYRAMQLDRLIGRVPEGTRARIAGRAEKFAPRHPKSRTSRLLRFLRSFDQPASSRYASYMGLFDAPSIAELFPDAQRNPPPTDLQKLFVQLSESRDPVRAALAVDRITYLPDDLLVKLDRASMLHALEVRSPFLDPALVQFAAGLNTERLLRGGLKSLLRGAFAADLPATVFRRPKMGFAVPIGDWFRTSLRELLHDNLLAANSFARRYFNIQAVQRLLEEHDSRHADHAHRLYALLMLELWWQQK